VVLLAIAPPGCDTAPSLLQLFVSLPLLLLLLLSLLLYSQLLATSF
jgi:hypothetical protein